MDAIDNELKEWNEKELEASKKGRCAIIMGKLWSIPKGYVIVCQKFDFIGIKKLIPVAIAKLKDNELTIKAK